MVLASLVCVQPVSRADVPDERLETPLAFAFGAPPTIGHPMLSPDGAALLFTQQDPQGVSILRRLDFRDGTIRDVLRGAPGSFDISWCEIAGETRVFCLLRKGLPDQGPDTQRLVAIDFDGTNLRAMPELLTCLKWDRLRDQPPIDWAPDLPRNVLYHCGASASTQPPQLLDTYSGRLTDVRGPGPIADIVIRQPGLPFVTFATAGPGDLGRRQDYFANGRGLVNVYRGRQDNHDYWFARADLDSEWRQFLTVDPLAFETPFRPVGYGAELGRVFNIGWNAATETWALFLRTLTEGGENSLVFARDAVDVELVDAMGKYNRVVAAVFLDGHSRRTIVDPHVAEVYAYVAGQLPGLEVEILDESWDRSRYLARARPANGAGELLFVDMANESIATIGPEYAHLSGYPLAETRLVEIDSSTGGRISAHLTLPQGVRRPASAAALPAVILPRGRPSHDDVADPHFLVQFLAGNGYAVLRVANRVEPEYGRGWLVERAIIGWRQSAADIRDAANFLVENGIAAEGSICAAGMDYGAYTAYMTAIEYPDILQCIVGIGGVADPRETPGGVVIEAGVTAARGALQEASPLRRAEEIGVPILMFHGRYDHEFYLSKHSMAFETALRRAGKDVTLVEYPEATHGLGRGPDRVDMLARIRGFLAEQIGPELTETESNGGTSAWRL